MNGGITIVAKSAKGHTAGGARIADAVRAQIVSGELAPGARIGQEALAEQFDASRMPVREALRMLEAEGLVRIETHRGAWVARLDFEEFRKSYRMRAALEPLAVAESLPNLADDVVDELFIFVTRIRETTTGRVDVGAFLELDREFHLLTYSGVQFTPMSSTINRLWNMTQHYRRVYISRLGPSEFENTHADHFIIADAIRRRDAESAADATRIHIRRTLRSLEQMPGIFDAD